MAAKLKTAQGETRNGHHIEDKFMIIVTCSSVVVSKTSAISICCPTESAIFCNTTVDE